MSETNEPETKQRKRGVLSKEEENFILANKDKLSIQAIADALNRNPPPVRRFILERSGELVDGAETQESVDYTMKIQLRNKPYYKELVKQFSRNEDIEELQYFERMWIALMKQFKGNVLMTEEMDIKQWLTYEILINRCMKERKAHLEELARLQRLLDKEYEVEKEHRDASRIMSLEQQIGFARAASAAYTNEHTKLSMQIKDIRNSLKAARSDRIKKIEDGKVTFIGLVKQLQLEEERVRQGMEAEILSRAADKARVAIAKQHKYEDEKFDRPFLTPETINLDLDIEYPEKEEE